MTSLASLFGGTRVGRASTATRGRAARALLLAGASLLLAGCAAPGGGHGGGHGGALDTGAIPPGEERTLTFGDVGTVGIHCHPHPSMKQAVTVTDAPAAPMHVHVWDGAEEGSYRFEPAELSVGRGSVVTYHNHGALEHTATQDGR